MIYYYNEYKNVKLIGVDFLRVSLNNRTTGRIIRAIDINMYREQLLRYLEDYQIKFNYIANNFSKKGNEEAKIYIGQLINPNDIELKKDYKKIKNKIGDETRAIIKAYTTHIMFMVGKIAECIIIDNCKRDYNLNMKCINYACFKNDINENYSDIDYNKYTPFSPSHKRIVMYSDQGIVYYKENSFYYEPNHINKDIIWCNKEAIEECLRAKILFTQYDSPAKLQVKSSTNFRNIVWDNKKYRSSPIVYFDLNRDINKLYNHLESKKSMLYVRSVLDFDYGLMEECIWYFRLLAGHFFQG